MNSLIVCAREHNTLGSFPRRTAPRGLAAAQSHGACQQQRDEGQARTRGDLRMRTNATDWVRLHSFSRRATHTRIRTFAQRISGQGGTARHGSTSLWTAGPCVSASAPFFLLTADSPVASPQRRGLLAFSARGYEEGVSSLLCWAGSRTGPVRAKEFFLGQRPSGF